MPSHQHDFMFDVNFSFAEESVFTLVDETAGQPLPPIVGYLLLTDNTPFLLTDGVSFLALA